MSNEKKEIDIRFRTVYIIIGSFLVIMAHLISDPDIGLLNNLPLGAGIIATILILLKTVIYAAAWHITRKGLFDYVDFEELLEGCKKNNQYGQAAIAVAICFLAIVLLIMAAVK